MTPICRLHQIVTLIRPPKMRDVRLVSGANHSHQRSLRQLLSSIPDSAGLEILVYDLGMDPEFTKKLRVEFPNVHFTTFDFIRQPPHVNIEVAAGQYAWKPILISEVSLNYAGLLIWCDAGNILPRSLRPLINAISRTGFLSPYSSGSVEDWTHPACSYSLNASVEILKARNLNGALVGLDCDRPGVRALIQEWARFAQDPLVISPPGSDRSNHRQDQSLLSILARKHQLVDERFNTCFTELNRVRFHQDID